jgi:uncharacterized protein (TIGR02246 family)
MNARTTRTQTSDADERAIRAIPERMAAAWNAGSAEDFAAAFADDADFMAFEGTHLKGRREIVSFHQRIFDTTVKGSRIEGRAKFVRFVDPHTAVLHAVARVALPGQATFSPSRDSMQLFVVTKRDGEWRVESVLNARILTLERQYFLDEIDALPTEAQHQVTDLVASLARGRRAGR